MFKFFTTKKTPYDKGETPPLTRNTENSVTIKELNNALHTTLFVVKEIENQVKSLNTMAVFIDGDNISVPIAEFAIERVSKRARIVRIEIFAANETKGRWDTFMKNHNGRIKMNKVHNIKGKNSTDIALGFELGRISKTENVESFCIVSNDRDFAYAIDRLRSKGKVVIGVGTHEVNPEFKNMYDEFLIFPQVSFTTQVLQSYNKVLIEKQKFLDKKEVFIPLKDVHKEYNRREQSKKLDYTEFYEKVAKNQKFIVEELTDKGLTILKIRTQNPP